MWGMGGGGGGEVEEEEGKVEKLERTFNKGYSTVVAPRG